VDTLTATSSVHVDVEPSAVWTGITDPATNSEIYFGARVDTDWREGSPITFTGDWKGTSYVDKGEILRVEPERLLQFTYWSSMGGSNDEPDNYATITFRLAPRDGGTELTVTQDKLADEEGRAQAESNWRQMLDNVKQVIEKRHG